MPPSPPETRASLILRLPNAADVAAWDEFVSVYGPLVYRVARGQGLQSADADDLVQEVFSAVAKQVGDWVVRPDRGRFRAWLLRIARNIAVNLLTRKPFGAVGMGGDEAERRLAEIPEPVDEFSSQFDMEYRREVFRWAAEQVGDDLAGVSTDARGRRFNCGRIAAIGNQRWQCLHRAQPSHEALARAC
jgi:RNA polymerase sigma-70 factor (ECF subfamily)